MSTLEAKTPKPKSEEEAKREFKKQLVSQIKGNLSRLAKYKVDHSFEEFLRNCLCWGNSVRRGKRKTPRKEAHGIG